MKKITKKLLNYTDVILDEDLKLKIEQIKDGSSTIVKITLPTEKSFFRGVKFSEKVHLERLKNGSWVKTLRAKFGAGGEELFGLTEINEQSDLEARDIRIIAAVEKLLSANSKKLKVKKVNQKLHQLPA